MGWNPEGKKPVREEEEMDNVVSRCGDCMLISGIFCKVCRFGKNGRIGGCFCEASALEANTEGSSDESGVLYLCSCRGTFGDEGEEEEVVEASGTKIVNNPESYINRRDFPTKRRIMRRDLSEAERMDPEIIRTWAEGMKFTLGPALPSEKRMTVWKLLWTYRHLGIEELSQLPQTDLITSRIRLKPGAVPYAMKGHRRLSPSHLEFFQKTIQEGLDCGMYERTPSDEEFSTWSAPPVIVVKVPDDPNYELRLTFD
ncbi:MAG: hypothetical protein JWM47_4207, partial [Acidimicrobiales bacterium]|nr:hypothetical protein [Acidimicrobiales bacterium]